MLNCKVVHPAVAVAIYQRLLLQSHRHKVIPGNELVSLDATS